MLAKPFCIDMIVAMIQRLIPIPLRRWMLKLANQPRRRAAERAVMRRPLGEGRAHELATQLVVSLTSYPARFGTLHLTLRSLLQQSVRPDRVLLWVASEDIAFLPEAVTQLRANGLEIRETRDIRSFKKLVPALEAFPDSTIVTADDDLYYPPDWLEQLVETDGQTAIVCHRAHRLKIGEDGAIAPYRERENDVQDEAARTASHDLLFTTGAGVLFPPGSLDPIVTDDAKFLRLCPHGDDLWFSWCAGLAGTPVRKVGPRFKVIGWTGTDEDSLWQLNERGRNDAMIKALESEFGPGRPVAR